MGQQPDFSFHKAERLCSRRLIEALFSGGNKSMSAFPLRVLFMPLPAEAGQPSVSVLVSVSKRRFKRAVRRNRVKRQIREAYRKNKRILVEALEAAGGQRLAVAFLWLSDRLYPSAEVERCVRLLLARVSEQIVPPAPLPSDDEQAM